MKIVVAGRNAGFETLAAASSLLEGNRQKEVLAKLGEHDLGRRGEPVWLGQNELNQEIYVIGIPNYDLLPRIKKQLEAAARRECELIILPFKAPGEVMTALLLKLSVIPGLGDWFWQWAKQRVKSRQDEILHQAVPLKEDCSFRDEARVAAKPFRK